MKKSLIVLSVVTALFVAQPSLSAQPVDRSQALKRARQFMYEKGRRISEQIHPARARAAGDMSQPAFYVFNADQQQGFVIISGDDRLPSVLGYSERGSYVDEDMPENMRSWLQAVSDNIDYMQRMNVTRPRRAIENLGEPIKSQLTCRWDQFTPFNNDCPIVYVYADSARTIPYEKPSGRGVTGCAATALAQVLYQWKYPSKTLMEIPAVTSIKGENVAKNADGNRQSVWTVFSDVAIPAGTPIEWDKMIDEYTHRDANRKVVVDADGNIVVEGTPEQQAAIASLMHICGAAQNMAYGPDFTSGSATAGFLTALGAAAYLGYINVTYQQQGAYDYDTWIRKLYDELKVARAVNFNGSSSSGGHAFVIDGYEKEDIFHVNWGWSGLGDGLYRICELLPEEQGTGGAFFNDGFRCLQAYLTGIYPDAKMVAPDVHCNIFNSDVAEVDVKEGRYTLPITIMTLNMSHLGGYEAQLALGVFGDDGKLLAVSDTIKGQCDFMSGIMKTGEPMTITLTETMPKVQTVRLCYRLQDGDEWKVCTGDNELRVTIDDASAKAKVEKIPAYTLENVDRVPVYTFAANEDIDFTCRAKVTSGVVHETVEAQVILGEMKDGAVLPVSSFNPVNSSSFNVLYGSKDTEFDITCRYYAGTLQPGVYLLRMHGLSSLCDNYMGLLVVTDPTGIVEMEDVRGQQEDANAVFDLQGRPVSSPQRGIFIRNGKKVIYSR